MNWKTNLWINMKINVEINFKINLNINLKTILTNSRYSETLLKFESRTRFSATIQRYI